MTMSMNGASPGLAGPAATTRRTVKGRLGKNFALNLRQYGIQSIGRCVMADIRIEVANALHWDVAVPRHRVTAKVDDGWVTLKGVVDWAYQRSCAEADVRRVPGVIGIKNEIALRAVEEPSQPSLGG